MFSFVHEDENAMKNLEFEVKFSDFDSHTKLNSLSASFFCSGDSPRILEEWLSFREISSWGLGEMILAKRNGSFLGDNMDNSGSHSPGSLHLENRDTSEWRFRRIPVFEINSAYHTQPFLIHLNSLSEWCPSLRLWNPSCSVWGQSLNCPHSNKHHWYTPCSA